MVWGANEWWNRNTNIIRNTNHYHCQSIIISYHFKMAKWYKLSFSYFPTQIRNLGLIFQKLKLKLKKNNKIFIRNDVKETAPTLQQPIP